MNDHTHDLLAMLREVRLALDFLLKEKPMLAGRVCGSTTLGNLKAEIGGLIKKATGVQP